MTEDMYALEQWLLYKEFEAHVAQDPVRIEIYEEVITKIQNMRVSQRPHMSHKV